MVEKEHWEKIYASKTQQEFSWYQQKPATTIRFFESLNLPKDAAIIDVGGGDTFFVDYLLENGYTTIYVLDISENAIKRTKLRLGVKSEKVHFIVSDILEFEPTIQFDFWHDRAVFHFLTNASDIEKYVSKVSQFVVDGKYLLVATFSETGPLKCSGLNITQYSKELLEKTFSNYFNKIECLNEVHETPFNTTQNFTYCLFKKE